LSEQVEDILQRLDALPRLDKRSDDEILEYNQLGVPETGDEKNPNGH
jgi:hypothetical protein